MSDIYRSRWDVCDDCDVAVIVERDDSRGVPDEDDWDDRPSCPVCGSFLSFGNADEQTIRTATYKQGARLAWSSVARALFDAADELEKHLDEIGGWKGVAYKGSPGWLRDKAEAALTKSKAVSA